MRHSPLKKFMKKKSTHEANWNDGILSRSSLLLLPGTNLSYNIDIMYFLNYMP